MKSKTLIYFFILLFPYISFGQGSLTICNSFDTNSVYISIDSNSVWEIGAPNKTILNSSYVSANSIVTDTISPYPNNDTSIFYMVFTDPWGWIPNYLGLYSPLEIEFHHRYLTDSTTDFGKIEMSLDHGATWYDVLSNTYNATWGVNGPVDNFHHFESTNDTIFDSLEVHGSSNGWVHSKISKNVEQIIWNDGLNPDSILLKFSFISDSTGVNEGWQIDNLCVSMEYISSIEDRPLSQGLLIYPNPNVGKFELRNETGKNGLVRIYSALGKEIYSQKIDSSISQNISLELIPGIYIVVLSHSQGKYVTKFIMK
jgi:hypothetical protein